VVTGECIVELLAILKSISEVHIGFEDVPAVVES
jgi:hypothetical protein